MGGPKEGGEVPAKRKGPVRRADSRIRPMFECPEESGEGEGQYDPS